MVSKVIPVDPFDLVIFGASGDLAHRKILPGLFQRYAAGQIPEGARIIGSASREMTDEQFRDKVHDTLKQRCPRCAQNLAAVDGFLQILHYIRVNARGDEGWAELSDYLRDGVVRAFYLSVAPSLFGPIASKLSSGGMARPDSRIVVEKPFGHDLDSARMLNQELRNSFEEQQIYRIDHYLGKETVQNLMALRFANALFEPLWNARHIDHVQITVAEDISVAGRADYYDRSGAIKDMVQNHLMQLLCLTAMEPPSRFEPNAVRDEKLKVIRALEPVSPRDVVRGQYRSTDKNDDYLEHSGQPDSRTETYVAMKVRISNWRWNGTPFYLRTGKRLRRQLSEIAVIFREPPHSIFAHSEHLSGNALIIRLQPDEGITLRTIIKDPGPGGMRFIEAPLDMTFAEALLPGEMVPDAYERLIMDVIRGDQTLFMRGDEVEEAWEWIDPVTQSWESNRDKPSAYDPGSSGPEEALMMMHQDGRRWRGIGV